MTTHFFASPGVGFGFARRNPRKTGMRRIRAGEKNRRTFVRPTKPSAKPAPGEAKKKPPSKKPFVIPGLTRNPVRQSNLAALRAGENNSGFRVNPGMS
jgi:hypothetical protein